MERNITPSEIIFAINFYIDDNEKIETYLNYVTKQFSKFHKFNEEDVETLIKVEKLKTDIRGSNVDHYLFSQNISFEQKIAIIENFYKNNAFWLFTFAEIAMAFNICWKLLSILEKAETKNKNPDIAKILKEKITLFENIAEEAFYQTDDICLYDDNRRTMYNDIYMPTTLEENEIKNYAKNVKKTKKNDK